MRITRTKIDRKNSMKRKKRHRRILTACLICFFLILPLSIYHLTQDNSSQKKSLIGGHYIDLKTIKEKSKSQTKESEKSSATTIELPTEDPNVKKSYTGSWKPFPTVQTEPHMINFDETSADVKEILQGVAKTLNLSAKDLQDWWFGRDTSERSAYIIIENQTNAKFYRIYLTWIENTGWQMTKIEELYQYPAK